MSKVAQSPPGPKVLIWDIETVQNLVASFTLWDRGGLHLPHRNVMQERYIVCASWKWLGCKTVESVSVLDNPISYKKNPCDDFHVVKTLHDILSQADVLVAHNGDSYDTKWVRGRMLFHKLKPLPPLITIDTKTVAQGLFNLNSNRLDYLARYLGLGQKKEIDPERWLEILRGGPKAITSIKEMVAYNKVDIEVLEKVFNRLKPWIPKYPNLQLYVPGEGCPRCGSKHVTNQGVRRASTRMYQRFQCQDCGGWFKSSKSIGSAKLINL